jgi:CxxC-x17-CxxC domain-containing protein
MNEEKLRVVLCKFEGLIGEMEQALNCAPGVPVEKVDGSPADDAPHTPDKLYPCSDCGKMTTVPFKPNPNWKIRCMACYEAYKNGQKK